MCCVAPQYHAICCRVVSSCAGCVGALLFDRFVKFCNIIAGPRCVSMLTSLILGTCFQDCDRRSADVFFSVSSDFTKRSRVLRLLSQSFYSRKHPQKLGQFDLL